jgi:hypothetical protein
VLGAVLLSPTALLALPWLFAFRAFSVEEGRGRPAWVLEALGPFCAALFAVGIQSLWDAPSWWISDRGVLNAMGGVSPRPFGVWARALWLPALLAVGGFRQRGSFGLAWTLPLLLAPADVPTWLLAGAPLALGAAAAWARSGAPLRAALLVLLSVQGILSLRAQEQEIRRVARVTAITEAMAARLLTGEALLAPWGWGVRVGVAATRDPYGVPWAPLEGPPPARALRWCGAEIRRVALLPPGVRPDPNPDLDGEGFRDEHGVSWFDVDPGVWQRRLGCEDVALREASPPG